jgi:hypothetical protein
MISIIDACTDQNLFRSFLSDGSASIATWRAWSIALRALYGLPVRGSKSKQLVEKCTGRTQLPKDGFDTALFLTGRRSGKSRTAAIIGAYEACLSGRHERLSEGETGLVLIASPSRAQSRIVHNYVRAIFEIPMLKAQLRKELNNVGFELKNGVRVEIQAADWRTVRGYTLLAAVVDEAAFLGYDSESKVKSDTELIRAIQPSLATTGGKLIAISSPYAEQGWCYRQHKKHYAKDDAPVLVWNTDSQTMNPTLPNSVVQNALAEDEAAARAEYLGEFRQDIATYLPREVIEKCVAKGRKQLSPQPGQLYFAFVDISGGRSDDAALAVAHRELGKIVLDYVRSWRPPFSPDDVVGEMVEELKPFGVDRVVGDNYSAEFVKSSFEVRGIRYGRTLRNVWNRRNVMAEKSKSASELYLELLPRICSQEVELLDDEKLIDQLANLERRTRVGGRDIVDHPPGQHDDVANAVAGAVDCAAKPVRQPLRSYGASDPYGDRNSAMRARYSWSRGRHPTEGCEINVLGED